MELSGGYWDLSSALNTSPSPASFSQHDAAAAAQALVLQAHGGGGGGTAHHHYQIGIPVVDPHLTCLKLGKRHYFEDGGERRLAPQAPALLLGGKRGKGFGNGGAASCSSSSSSASPAVGPVPRCQVEGCNLALINAKDYHRRHKVCEMHSKAPKVVVLGMEQRFCQQCSRFHVVSEFDDSKRSCRRRLAGHNERRRKNTNESMGKNPSQEFKTVGGSFPCITSSPKGCALSLLSSKTYPASPWESSADLSLRSSAALRELIAENRAAILARQFISDRGWPQVPDQAGEAQPFLMHTAPHHQQHQLVLEAPGWALFHEPAVNVTLDLMQAPSSSYPIVQGRSKPKDNDECCEIWKSLEGTHVV